MVLEVESGANAGLYAMTFDPFDHFFNDSSGLPLPIGYQAFKEALAGYQADGIIGTTNATIEVHLTGSGPNDVNSYTL